MKKLFNCVAVLSIFFVNAISLTSCKNIANNKPYLPVNSDNELKIDSKTNIDLEKRYLPHPILLQKRDYKGTLFNQYKIDTIKNLTNDFLSKTENLNLSNNLETEFNTYEQLQSYLNLEQQNFWQDLSKNICQKYQDNLKQIILSFYNFVVSIWNKTNINEILKKIEIKNIIDGDDKVLGQANTYQTILINKNILSCAFEKVINSEWHKAQFTTNNFLHILTHELVHIFYFYDWKKFKINHIFYLKQFLAKKINNLNKHTELNEEKILKIFANSNYALSDSDELLAEGFAYWLLTKQDMQTKSWEFWNEYFTSYLPQIRNKS